MKNMSACATFSDTAKSLFETKESSREIAKEVLKSRKSGSGHFVVKGLNLRTERTTKRK